MKPLRLVSLIAVLLLAAGGLLVYRVFEPYRGFSGQTFVDIPHGTPTDGIAERLARAGVVRSRWDFLAARVIAHGRGLKAGEYRFTKAESPVGVYDRIARGDVFYYDLVVPEGRNMYEIATAVEHLGLFSAERFLEAARDAGPVRDLDPQAPDLEGYLFPSTYKLSRHTTPAGLCRIMTNKFREVWRGLKTNANVHQTVTLASLVEKECKVPEDRRQVAAVFTNRLRLGMKLDCDPTTIYAALREGRYRGSIYRSDLDRDDPYNTYRHAGLPPGPIANPGRASIEAALDPAAIDALYFVLRPDGSGAHQFSKTLSAHDAAVARYRRAAQ